MNSEFLTISNSFKQKMSAIWKSYNISFVYEHKNSYSYERLKVNLKSLDPNAFDELCEVILLHKPNVKYPLIIFYIGQFMSIVVEC